jgi:secreted trypsin-like serine protease
MMIIRASLEPGRSSEQSKRLHFLEFAAKCAYANDYFGNDVLIYSPGESTSTASHVRRACYVSVEFVASLQTANALCPTMFHLRLKQAARRAGRARCSADEYIGD